jgi:hemolysin activation/secretion protein
MGADVMGSREQGGPDRGTASLLRIPQTAEIQLIEGNKQGTTVVQVHVCKRRPPTLKLYVRR